jgi:competence protein CoiA
MRFALVDGVKSEPQPKSRGVCTHCEAEMIAKCGNYKVWHWAHKSREMCDPWWENESEWHREWKGCFPPDWQEVSHQDTATAERHIADVKNPFGLVIEFQYSPISHEERDSREQFYENMVWVVSGLRGLDKQYFSMGLSGPIQDDPLAYQMAWWSKSRLFHNWAQSNVKVFFDFGDDNLWRLVHFDAEKKVAIVGPMPKSIFISFCSDGNEVGVVGLAEGADKEGVVMPRFAKVE